MLTVLRDNYFMGGTLPRVLAQHPDLPPDSVDPFGVSRINSKRTQ
jgi:hypothetical protein